MSELRGEDVEHAPSPFAERVGPRSPRIVWCCTCDGAVEIGPHDHLGDHPDHYVVEAAGEFHVWRNPSAIGEEAALERAHWWNQGAKMERPQERAVFTQRITDAVLADLGLERVPTLAISVTDEHIEGIPFSVHRKVGDPFCGDESICAQHEPVYRLVHPGSDVETAD